MQSMVINYISALSNYRNTVKQRHPKANNLKNTRRIIQTQAGRGGKGRGRGRGSGHGGGVQKGRRYGNPNDCCNDEWQVTGIYGNMIELHPSYCLNKTSGSIYLRMYVIN